MQSCIKSFIDSVSQCSHVVIHLVSHSVMQSGSKAVIESVSQSVIVSTGQSVRQPESQSVTRVKYLHGIPWSSMEFDGIFSMEFHGVLGHGFPWNSMEYFPGN